MSRWIKKAAKKAGITPGEPIYTGEVKDQHVHITVMDYNESHLTEECPIDTNDVQSFIRNDSTTWLDYDGIHQVDIIQKAGEIFGLHPLLSEDILHTGQRPKAEEYENHFFVILQMLLWDEEKARVVTEQISLVLGPNYVVSFQEKPGDCFEWVRKQIRTSKGHIRSLGPDYLFYALIDAIVDNYFIVMEKIGNQIEDLEEKIMNHPTKVVLTKLNRLKREMIHIRKALFPLREAVHVLIKSENKMFKRKTGLFFRDLNDHLIQIIEIIDSYREMLGGLFDIYLSTISNRLNEIMKVLTVFTAIFIPLTFLAGIYGMNFDFIPELHWKFGYFGVLGLMTLIGGGMLLWFKRRRWL